MVWSRFIVLQIVILLILITMPLNKKAPWHESGSELYRPSVRHLSAKLVPTFTDRGVSRSQRGGSPTAVIFNNNNIIIILVIIN
jgi:hypothetical protein